MSLTEAPTPTRPEGPSVEETERGLDLGDEGKREVIHWGWPHHVHTFCGLSTRGLRPPTRAEERKHPLCPDCHRIARMYVEGHGWEGFGPKPGREASKDLEREVRREEES